VADQFFERLAVGRNSVRQRIAGDLHHPLMQLVDGGWLFDRAGFQAFEIKPLGGDKGIEYVGGERRVFSV
jgi:hypothetical protein